MSAHGINEDTVPVRKYDKDSQEQKALEKAVIQAYAANNYSALSFFGSPSMLRLFHLLNPRFSVPSPTKAHELAKAYAQQLREEIRSDLSRAQHISITTDMWSRHGISFMGVTAMALKHTDRIETYTLGMFEFSGSHTANALVTAFEEVVTPFIPMERVTALTTDNASNMRSFARKLKVNHIPCFAHLLQLVVRAGLSEIGEFINKCSDLAKFTRKSHIVKMEFQRIQGQNKRNIPMANDTRWGSTYLMLSTLLEERDHVDELKRNLYGTVLTVDASPVQDDQDYEEPSKFGEDGVDEPPLIHNVPSGGLSSATVFFEAEDWSVLATVVDYLKTFADLTIELQGENMHLSDVLIMAHSLHNRLQAEVVDEPEIITKMRKAMHLKSLKMEVPFKVILDPDSAFMICTALDPRYACATTETILSMPQTVDKIIKTINAKTAGRSPSTTPCATSEPIFKSKRSSSVAALMSESLKPHKQVGVMDEYSQYIKTCQALSQKDLETLRPLDWWIGHKYQFPLLAQLALAHLTMQPTEVPSERLFSAAGRIYTKARARLLGETIENLLIIHDNDRALKNDRRPPSPTQ